MTEPLSPEQIAEILSRWVQGQTVRQIASAMRVSPGAISKHTGEQRRKRPELDELRELNLALAEAKVPILDTLRVANILRDLAEAGVDVGSDSLAKLAALAKKYGDGLDRAVEAGARVKHLEESGHGKFEQIAAEANALEGRLEELNVEIKRKESHLKATTDKLGDLAVYESLGKQLDELGVSAIRLAGFADYHKELDGLGFTEKAARALAKELGTHGSVPAEAAKVLAHLLKDHQSLEGAVSGLELERKRLEKEAERLKIEVGGAKGELAALTMQKEGLTETNEALNDTVRNLRATVKTKESELRTLSEQADKARKEGARIAKELSEIDESIEGIVPLAIVASLLAGGEAPYPRERVLAEIRTFLTAVREYLVQHQGEIQGAKVIADEMGKVIGELRGSAK